MIQGSLEWTKDVRAKWLPNCAIEHDPRSGIDKDGAGDGLRRRQNCTSCTLLNEIDEFVDWCCVEESIPCLSWFYWAWKSQPLVYLRRTQFTGFPWISQHISLVCPWWLQWSHHIRSPWRDVLELLLFFPGCKLFLVFKAELSICWWCTRQSFRQHNFSTIFFSTLVKGFINCWEWNLTQNTSSDFIKISV